MFEQFEATFRETTYKEELLLALKSLYGNENLLSILETLKEYIYIYELPDEFLKEKMLGEYRVYVPTMYSGVSA